MASRIIIDYRDGKMSGLTMYRPTRVGIIDCRDREGDPFITVSIGDGDVELKAYLPTRLAVEFHELLDGILTPHDHMEQAVT